MIAKIETVNGNKQIVIDQVPYLPVAYRSFRPVPSNIRLFSQCGVKLYQMLVSGRKNGHHVPYSYYGGVWVGEGEYDFSPFDRQLDMFRKFAPDCKLMVMLQLDAPEEWLRLHPKSPDGYWRIGEAAMDEEWIGAATDYLKAFLQYAEERYQDVIFGYAFSGGYCTEWFDSLDYYTPSEKKADRFREWSGGAEVPTEEELFDSSGSCMREPTANTTQYRNFCCTLVPKVIRHFAKVIRQETKGNKIIGLFYGYIDSPDEKWQIATAINGYEEVWQDENIDMFFAPATYGEEFRGLEGASSYQYLVDSIALHNKLYLHEIDHRTFLADYPLDSGIILESYPDVETTVNVLRRELACTLTKGAALWWFDFYGGYYACPELAEEIVKEISVFEQVSKRPYKSASEIAVFVDPMGYNLLKESLDLTVDYVRNQLNQLHRCGAPIDTFNLSDLSSLDVSGYRLLVFLYAPVISPEVRATIEKFQGTKMFLHLPDVASGESLDWEAVGRICSMKLEPEREAQKGSYCGKSFGFHVDVTPLYQVTDSAASPMAYFENGDVAVAKKGQVIYSAVGNLPSSLWGTSAQSAGVHRYTERDIALYADARIVACQFPGEGTDQLYVQNGDGAYTELFSGETFYAQNGVLKFHHRHEQTMMFFKKELFS